MLHALLLMAATGAAMATPPGSAGNDRAWRDALAWRGQVASIEARDGGWVLHAPAGDRTIAPQPLRSETASPLFDGLFALAQQDLAQDKVDAITDWGFNHQQPLPCRCFETGEKWHYVWTRDLSFAADLALARLDPERTRTSLRFKLSAVRAPGAPQGLYVAQDTGSGGSWPVSTDRVVWFLAARHLLGDAAFADETWRALTGTLAQDRRYAFDPDTGLYRGETSFLDWREQSYPAWTAHDVTYIAESFALSTNVLHYEALRLAERMARRRHDPRAGGFATQAAALARAIDARFWRADRGMYASWIGSAGDAAPVDAYDLLATALVIDSGIAPPGRARLALARYPVAEAGSPVIWPQRSDAPIYHNRAIWPFVSAYALRAARKVEDPARIAFEVRSLVRGAALAGSNMENFELATQSTHVDDGALSGPVVDSPRQLWSVAGYLDMVIGGVFGVGGDGRVGPKIPAELVPMLFGDRRVIALDLGDRRIVLQRPARITGNLLVAGPARMRGSTTTVQLVARQVVAAPLAGEAARVSPPTPDAPRPLGAGAGWQVSLPAHMRLYVDGKRFADAGTGGRDVPLDGAHCLHVVRLDADGLESLPSPTACTGGAQQLAGDWPRTWTAPRDGRYRVRLRYANAHGPINTGITAAVKTLRLQCGTASQAGPIVMPHREGEGLSTAWVFTARAGVPCRFALAEGFNMSGLAHFRLYTGGEGGEAGPLNDATIDALAITPAR
ncbi:MAG TPA: Six-hairpin glycosidase-like protein [Xanthomonadaceae bacterium]|nr:Six-hairpin glycosidase-like protein [Xanthomonadaceae bacterium]